MISILEAVQSYAKYGNIDLTISDLYTSTGKKLELMHIVTHWEYPELGQLDISNELLGDTHIQRGESYDDFDARVYSRLTDAEAHNEKLKQEWRDEVFGEYHQLTTHYLARVLQIGGTLRHCRIRYISSRRIYSYIRLDKVFIIER